MKRGCLIGLAILALGAWSMACDSGEEDNACSEANGCVDAPVVDDVDVVADTEASNGDSKQEDPCVGACAGTECGVVDGCECGSCGEGLLCGEAGKCVEEVDCDALCAGFVCGFDGVCDCGSCDAGCTCIAGACDCPDPCANKECGDDGAGGSCGDCPGEQTCATDGKCYSLNCFKDIVFHPAQKVTWLGMGHNGTPGEALDVDGDPDTCAPADDCEGGLDNQLSDLLVELQTFIDTGTELEKALEAGEIVLLVEFVNYTDDGTPFVLNTYLGDVVDDKETCDWQMEACNYTVKSDSFNPGNCERVVAFDNATVVDGHLHAGGPDYLFKFSIPISEVAALEVTANMAQLVADVVPDGEGIKLENGIIGGALRKDMLMEAVNAIPDDANLPVSKGMVGTLLDMFVVSDIDTDGDGEPDAASFGLKFEAIAGTITDITWDVLLDE